MRRCKNIGRNDDDMEQWHLGDQTLVGDMACIFITIFLMIHAHVGKHLFQKCIQGFPKNKSVILVTHQLQHLQETDEIIVLKQGKVKERVNLKNLLTDGMDQI